MADAWQPPHCAQSVHCEQQGPPSSGESRSATCAVSGVGDAPSQAQATPDWAIIDAAKSSRTRSAVFRRSQSKKLGLEFG